MDEHDDVLRSLEALDRQPAPDPRFEMQLGDELMPARNDAIFATQGTSSAEAQLPRKAVALRPALHSPRSWMRSPVLSVAVMLTVIAIVGLAVVIGGRDKGGDHAGMVTVASPAASVTTADLVACTVEPRQLTDVTQLVRWVVEGIPKDAEFITPTATANAVPSGPALPTGAPASAEMTAEVNRVFLMYTACKSDGDYLRAYALFTDDGIARMLAPAGVPDILAISHLSQTPASSKGMVVRIHSYFTRVEVLPDGRVVGYQPESSNPEGYVIFKQIDGRWLIDEVFESHG